MTEPINIRELRACVTPTVERVSLTTDDLLALVTVVEAAQERQEADDKYDEDVARGLSSVVLTQNRRWQDEARARLREALAGFDD